VLFSSDSTISNDTTNDAVDLEKQSIEINGYALKELGNDQKRLIAKFLAKTRGF
jgi:hypothetical protein